MVSALSLIKNSKKIKASGSYLEPILPWGMCGNFWRIFVTAGDDIATGV
jgi:biotin carboxyl carrier protein